MAAPSFYGAEPGFTDAGGAWTYNFHTIAGLANGDLVVVQVLQDGSTAGAVALSTVQSGISDLAGTDAALTSIGSFASGGVIQHLWIGRKTGNPSGNTTGSNSTSEDLYFRAYWFRDVSTGTTLATVIENATAGATTNGGATGATVADSSVQTLGPDRLALNFVGLSDDNAISAFTGMTGGTWAEAVAEYAEASGTDASIGLQGAYVGNPETLLLSGGGSHPVGTTALEQVAQSYTAAGTSYAVTLKLAIAGSPSDNLTVTIESDSSDTPSGSVLGTATILSSDLSTTPKTLTVVVNAATSGSTKYWVRIKRTGSLNDSNYFLWYQGNAYASNTSKVLDDGSWSDIGSDRAFGIQSSGSGSTIDGGTFTQADSADGWNAVGFALIGTTVIDTTPRHGFVNFQDPGVFCRALDRTRGILVPKLWTPEGATI